MMPGRYPKGRAGRLGGLAGRFGQVLAIVEAVAVRFLVLASTFRP